MVTAGTYPFLDFVNFMAFFTLGMLSWSILFIVSGVFLKKAIANKNVLQSIIFGACFSFSIYMLIK